MTRRHDAISAMAVMLGVLLAGCSAVGGAPQYSAASAGAEAATPRQYFNCLRERGEAVISAHRAGPLAGKAENGLSAMAATLDASPHVLIEVDVQQSADGVLFLLHDDRLDRTTTGTGLARAQPWAALAGLRLRDAVGAVTGESLPTLADALALAVARRAIVTLDIKRPTPFATVIDAVRAAGAERHVAIITYTLADAAAVARLVPGMMVSAGIATLDEADQHAAAGLASDQTLAWTGTSRPDAALFAALRARGIEPMFGTLGPPGRRLDDIWLADGDPSEYRALAASGAVVIATDRAHEVLPALAPPTCPLPGARP